MVSYDVIFVAHRIREFLARRHLAKAVARHEDLDLGQHLEHTGDADLQLEDVVADICTGDADGGDHRLDGVGHDRLIRDGEQNVLVDGHHAAADVLAAGGVGEQDVDRHVDLAAHASEAGPVAQPLHRQVADGALRRRRAAAFKGDGHVRLGVAAVVDLVVGRAAAGAGNQTVADQRDVLIAQLLLLHGTSISYT